MKFLRGAYLANCFVIEGLVEVNVVVCVFICMYVYMSAGMILVNYLSPNSSRVSAATGTGREQGRPSNRASTSPRLTEEQGWSTGGSNVVAGLLKLP